MQGSATPKDARGLRHDVRIDWEWASKFEREAISHAVYQMFVKCSSIAEDFRGTDWKVDGAAAISCRLRRLESARRYRDFTLRVGRASGATTELAKIRDGIGDYYVYGWIDGDRLEEYIVISLDVFRNCGLAYLDRAMKKNMDGRTWFVAYRLEELWECGCIIAGEKYPSSPVSFQWVVNDACWHVPKLVKQVR